MRLIDADGIDFGKVFIGTSDFAKDTREAAQNLIDSQPTAYDVDKVVERLEEKILNTSDTQLGISARMAFGEAIKIVKSGGIE